MRKFFMFGATAALATSLVAGAGSAAWASTAPRIPLPCAMSVKWIVGSSEGARTFAEYAVLAGYETVAFNDLSYPGPRVGPVGC